MKKTKLLILMAIVAVGTIVFQGCKTPDGPDPVPPTVNFLGGVEYVSSDVSLGVGATYKIGITATHSSKMNSFKVTLSTDGGPALPWLDSSINTENLTYELSDVAAMTVGVKKKYTFTVTDKDNLTTSKSVTVTSKGLDLIEYKQDVNGNPFKVWNFKGPKPGAFDLVLGSNLLMADPNIDKDIFDSTSNLEIDNWPARWVCLNNSKFKKVSSSTSYSSLTTAADLQNAWNNSGAELTVYTGIKKNDVFVYQLRNDPTKLALVGITDVVRTPIKVGDPADNNDYVQFVYKKPQ